MPRALSLTAEHIARLRREIADPGAEINHVPGIRAATEDDYAQNVAEMLATRPPGPFWLFGYGSLIWKPETAFIERRVALARGWRRRFCLGWDYRHRGSRDAPGLMMALDRGGQCKGVADRLPEDEIEAQLHKLIRREMSTVPSPFPWRWIDVVTTGGSVRALTFAMNRGSPRYVGGLPDEALADMLATAHGYRGSMAEYLFETVAQLESLGIRDTHLWTLQAMVATRLDAEGGKPA